jgi:hypothetical protein
MRLKFLTVTASFLLAREVAIWPACLITLAIVGLVAWPAPILANTLTQLRCQVHYAGETRTLNYPPVTDIYVVPAIPIGETFRFKVVVAGEVGRIDYVAIYTYSQTAPWNELLHQVKYLKPTATGTKDPAALTGQVYVYSRELHSELQYGCAIVEVLP